MNITYRQLAAYEAERISELTISNFTKMAWREVNGVRQWDADKFFICAGSGEETLAFYAALGCEDAKEPNQALLEKGENDIQLEYDLNMVTCK